MKKERGIERENEDLLINRPTNRDNEGRTESGHREINTGRDSRVENVRQRDKERDRERERERGRKRENERGKYI